jgi:hypothetical protein
MGWTTEESGFDSRQKQQIPIFSTASRPDVGLAQLLSNGCHGREADHSLPTGAEVKNAWSRISMPHTSSNLI